MGVEAVRGTVVVEVTGCEAVSGGGGVGGCMRDMMVILLCSGVGRSGGTVIKIQGDCTSGQTSTVDECTVTGGYWKVLDRKNYCRMLETW